MAHEKHVHEPHWWRASTGMLAFTLWYIESKNQVADLLTVVVGLVAGAFISVVVLLWAAWVLDVATGPSEA